MPDYLVISVLGEDQTGLIRALSQAATAHNCNILDTRMTVLGGEFALLMLIQGESTDITEAEINLAQVADEYRLTIIQKRTQPKEKLNALKPYRLTAHAMDHPGIVSDIAGFLSDHEINIDEMETGTYAAAHTGTPMFSLALSVKIQESIDVNALEQELVSFCDERNLDVTLMAQ